MLFKHLLFIFSFLSLSLLYSQKHQSLDTVTINKKIDELFLQAAPYLGHPDTSNIDWQIPISYLNTIEQYAIISKNQESYLYAQSYLAFCYLQNKDYPNMKATLETTDAAHEQYKIRDTTFSFYANQDYWWGKYYSRLGNYDSTAYYYNRLIQKIEQGFSCDFNPSDAFNNLGLIYTQYKDYEKAIGFYHYSIEAFSAAEGRIVKATRYQNIAKAYQKWGKLLQALFYFKKAIAAINDKTSLTTKTSIYSNFGHCYKEIGKLDSALIFMNQAIEIQANEKELIPVYLKRAKVYIQQKKYNLAHHDLDIALKTAGTMYFNKKHPNIGEIFYIKAQIATQERKYQAALQYLQKATIALTWNFEPQELTQLPDLNAVSSRPLLLKVLESKAKIWKKIGDFKQALLTYQTASDLLDVQRLHDIKSPSARYFLLAQSKRIYEQAIEVALALNDVRAAFAFSQKGHGLLLNQILMDKTARQVVNLPDSLFKIEQNFQQKIRVTERLQHQNPKNKTHQITLFEHRLVYQHFLKKLEQDYPIYYQIKYDIPRASVADIQSKLGSGTALLEYFVGEKNIYTFLISHSSIRSFKTPKTDAFLEQIETLQQAVAVFSSHASVYAHYSKAAYELYQSLVQPAVATLPDATTQLVIIPDEQLHYLPFQILLTQRPQEMEQVRYDLLDYLVKDYVLSYDYSSVLFSNKFRTTTQKKRQTVLGFAPSFDGLSSAFRNERLTNLLHNKKEVIEIQKIAGGTIYTDTAATATAFKREIGNYKIAHIASHATFSDTFSHSTIHFSDTILRPYEIYNLPSQLDLVVLSACQTAQGQLRKGEGMIGWTQAFLYAGCPSVVASLWKVNDDTTSDLMIDFYEQLFAGQAKNVALATAQRQYLNRTKASIEAHPYYWAAFIQVGNRTPIIDNHRFWWWAMLGLVSLLIVFGIYIKK